MAKFLTRAWALRWIKRLFLFVVIAFVCIAAVRLYDAQRKAPLSQWHTYVPHDMHADEIDHATWAQYIEYENRLFDSVRKNVTDKLPEEERVPANRYFSGSPIYPGHFRTDWNRSYTLMPEGAPRGVAVMVHGLTDSPYSLRHIALRASIHIREIDPSITIEIASGQPTLAAPADSINSIALPSASVYGAFKRKLLSTAP